MQQNDININLILHKIIIMSRSISEKPPIPGGGSLESPEEIRSLTDKEIIDLLYRTYGNYMYTIVRAKIVSVNLPEDDVNDCLSHVIMKFAENDCKRVRQFKGNAAFKTYLTMTCWNITTDYIRSEIRKEKMTAAINEVEKLPARSLDSGGFDLFADDPAALLLRKEREDLIVEAAGIVAKEIGRLDHLEQCIFHLRIDEGRSYREIDEFLDIDNSKYLFSRIVNKIKSAIDSRMRNMIEELLAES
jgi:RNA polymerase sigma factor (sigma-70 family)